MTTLDLLTMAFMNLWRRKLRAVLTALGMAIGTTSIVVMVSIGIGLNVSFENEMKRMGSLTKIQVNSTGGFNYDEKGNQTQAKDIKLNDKTVLAFKQIEHVSAVTPVVIADGYIKSGKYSTWVQMMGIDMDTADLFEIAASEGTLPEKGSRTKPNIMLTSDVRQSFFDQKSGKQAMDSNGNFKIDLMKDRIQLTFDANNIYDNMMGGMGGGPIRGEAKMVMDQQTTLPKGKMYNIKVTGILNNEENFEYYSTAFIDLDALNLLKKENTDYIYSNSSGAATYDTVWVKVDEIKNVQTISQQIHEMGYRTYSLNDQIESYKSQSKMIQSVLGAIGAVSMLVAAIGIMNTMMMSIYERTREIGIIKVLGCKMRNISRLFLTEAAYIGFIGGVAGLLVSIVISIILNKLLLDMNMRSVIPVWLAAGGVLFSAAVAMLSGLYPAFRAMRLSAIAAIRNE